MAHPAVPAAVTGHSSGEGGALSNPRAAGKIGGTRTGDRGTQGGHAMSSFDGDAAARMHAHLHSHLPADPALRVKALESLLVERGLVSEQTLDAWVELYADKVGPRRGAEVVARAWSDADFAARLAENAAEAIRDFGFEGNATGHLKAVFNDDQTHNLVVCTLCSCYPFSILGMSPGWYKSAAYRARAVREPRAVLAEFGTTLPEGVAVRVWDSASGAAVA